VSSPGATAAPPVATGLRRIQRRRGLSEATLRSRLLVGALLGLAALYFLLPVYWLAVASTKSTGDLFGSFGLWFENPDLIGNLGRVLSHDDHIYIRWIANSVVYAGVGGAVATLLAAAGGYALAKYPLPGRELIFNAVLIGVLVPGTALALPLFFLFSKVGLANSYWAVLLPSFVSPFGIYLCRIYAAAAVPDELIEAARIDGAGELRIFFKFGLRIMRPALITIFLFQSIGIWNNYFLPLVMLSDPDLYPVTLGLTSWQGFADRQPLLYQLTIGGAFLSVIPLMLAIVVLQRLWRTGLTQGSVKG
jgi:multiple sugar transport system permease protein